MSRRLDLDSLLAQLSKPGPSLDALYVISGDEPLLITEAADSVRAAALAAGHTERTSLVMDARSEWSAVTAATQNISLFGERRLIELKIPTGKPGRTGSDVLIQLAENFGGAPLDETIISISLPRLDRATRSSKWATRLLQVATTIEIPTIDRSALPRWIAQRLARQNQHVEPTTLEWIADKVEGNLLAAHQEIQKLALLYPEGSIDSGEVQRAVLNVARYDVFGLRDAMLAGDAAKTLNIVYGLRAEGEALPLVLWAVGEEIRVLARLASAQASGQDTAQILRQHRIFGPRERLIRNALTRLPPRIWPAAVQHAHDVDRLIKGLHVPGRLDDPWEELARLTLRITITRSATAA